MNGLLDFYKGVMRDGEVLPARGGLGVAPAQPAVALHDYSTVLSGALPRCSTAQGPFFQCP